ncbi:hypothetical protein [Saccharolobus islandicus]|uniref:hypothetical protein n=1 Tax=Saccharolobus islandicus TaxID=43080 RepID=UPI00068C8081|nr:hypothetical protein [Sulfolobus islandicus]
MQDSVKDYFPDFNRKRAEKVVEKCGGCNKVAILGPPRSGKSFFMKNYLEGKLKNVEELVVIPEGLAKVNQPRRLIEKLIEKIKDLTDVDIEGLDEILGKKAPKHVIDEVKGRIAGSTHFVYFIPWKEVEECTSKKTSCDEKVREALELINKVLNEEKRRIRWLNAEYIPPGLIKEVIELINGVDAEKVVREWVDAYFKVLNHLGISDGEPVWKSSLVEFIGELVNNFTEYYLPSLLRGIGLAATLSIPAAAAVAFITSRLVREEKSNAVNAIIELREGLKKLYVKGGVEGENKAPGGGVEGGFNELGRLIVYKLALAMGISYDDAESALKHITGLSEDELREEVKNVERKLEELEEKFNELSRNVELLKQVITAGVIAARKDDFAKGLVNPNVRVEGGVLKVRVEGGYYNVVRAGKFGDLVNQVVSELKDKGLVTVVGPKGIGKSILAASVIWELFDEIGLVVRVDSLADKYSEFMTFVENYVSEFGEFFGRLLILYDPSSTKVYEEKEAELSLQPKIETSVSNLLKLFEYLEKTGDRRPLILVVLPSDVYDALGGVKDKLNVFEVSTSLKDVEFLSGIIKEYSRCSELKVETLNELAAKIVKFDSGYALIARLVGEELVNKCNDVEVIKQVDSLIDSAENKAERFIALYINRFFDVVDEKGQPNIDRLKVLAEILAMRRPYVRSASPGRPLLTRGFIRTIEEASGVSKGMSEEMVNWLIYRKHDLIEQTIEKILDSKDLGKASEPWRTIHDRLLKSLSEKVTQRDKSAEYFAERYGKWFIDKLRGFSDGCWRRAAWIFGHGLLSRTSLLNAEDLPEDVRRSLGDFWKKCGVDDYLLVGDVIPKLTLDLIDASAIGFNSLNIFEAFADNYNGIAKEINMIYSKAEGRGNISVAEEIYGLGLVSILANRKDIDAKVAEKALKITSSAIDQAVSPKAIGSVLHVSKPLRDEAPLVYLRLLSNASEIRNLDSCTVKNILEDLSNVLVNYGEKVRAHRWPLALAVRVYASLLSNHLPSLVFKHFQYFRNNEVEEIVARITDLLNELDDTPLGKVAWAYALTPALEQSHVRRLMESNAKVDVVRKAGELLNEFGNVEEFTRDEDFTAYAKSGLFKFSEEEAEREIRRVASHLKHELAKYKLAKDELDDAERLFKEAVKDYKEIDELEDYLTNRNFVLRVGAIKGTLVGKSLAGEYGKLFNEALSNLRLTALYLGKTSAILGNYLVSLALTNDAEKVVGLLESHRWILDADKKFSVTTRLMLRALLGPDKFDVNPGELIEVFSNQIENAFLPALKVAFDLLNQDQGLDECERLPKDGEKVACIASVFAVVGDELATCCLRRTIIYRLKGLIRKGLINANHINDFERLVNKLDGKSLVTLFAARFSLAYLALLLHALINGNSDLAKAIALKLSLTYPSEKILTRLFLEAYKTCCDLSDERFRKALADLFFFHI